MDNYKIVPIIDHCKHIRKLDNYYRGHLPILYISSNIVYRGIYIRAYHRYDKFKKAPFETHLSLYSIHPIYNMIDISSTVPTDSDIEYFERSRRS